MSTDYQQAREALGARLRELRLSAPGCRLTGTELATLYGWNKSKVSRLENGRQTPTPDDLRKWAEATGQSEVYDELLARLRGFESHIRSWRRQLAAGHKPVQDTHLSAHADASVFRGWEPSMIFGILQTPDYARSIFTRYSELQRSPRDTEEAVRSRMKRQETLYDSSKRFHLIMWEAALHALVCPPSVLAAQLDRLAGAVGLDTVELGIIPLAASLKLPPATAFWIYDDRQVIVENWHAELWIDDEASVDTYLRTWKTLWESAVYGAEAHNLISAARRALHSR
ncbi:helix-turn-helix domain-containing protein [Streptomyces europaeiscabiei]|uniref:helix-turn-helix domain-containing protein n=1 Tax=Streptomyces europaeiscabiei TaxID=146819 RepID=UPI0029B64B7E|nr:helix-turn-helix transcriptional regulator [Streptomyces europaeiscabiei]MDX2771335.1 helix-turn-helix transcriptional regulator [Streptomyces europaeiscabiei]MDX3830975.1 helix-turn-helix transcriptional regulator [Streptomyces europaeiscabiei]